MSNRRRNIELALKQKILLESDEKGCVITALAVKYDITSSMIYAWRSDRNKSKSSSEEVSSNFVELLARDTPLLPTKTVIELEHIEVELRFKDFTFTIEGKLSNQKFRDVIELLSTSC